MGAPRPSRSRSEPSPTPARRNLWEHARSASRLLSAAATGPTAALVRLATAKINESVLEHHEPKLASAGRRVLSMVRMRHAVPDRADEDEDEDGSFEIGDRVELFGLRAVEYNGKRGVVVEKLRRRDGSGPIKIAVEVAGKKFSVPLHNARLDVGDVRDGESYHRVAVAAWKAEAARLRRYSAWLVALDAVSSAVLHWASHYPLQMLLTRGCADLEPERRAAAAEAASGAAAAAAERSRSWGLAAHEAKHGFESTAECRNHGSNSNAMPSRCSAMIRAYRNAADAQARADQDAAYLADVVEQRREAARLAGPPGAGPPGAGAGAGAGVLGLLLRPWRLFSGGAALLLASSVLGALADEAPTMAAALLGVPLRAMPRWLGPMVGLLCTAAPRLLLESRWARTLLPPPPPTPTPRPAPPPDATAGASSLAPTASDESRRRGFFLRGAPTPTPTPPPAAAPAPPVAAAAAAAAPPRLERWLGEAIGAAPWLLASRALMQRQHSLPWPYVQRLFPAAHGLREGRGLVESVRAAPLLGVAGLLLVGVPLPDITLRYGMRVAWLGVRTAPAVFAAQLAAGVAARLACGAVRRRLVPLLLGGASEEAHRERLRAADEHAEQEARTHVEVDVGDLARAAMRRGGGGGGRAPAPLKRQTTVSLKVAAADRLEPKRQRLLERAARAAMREAPDGAAGGPDGRRLTRPQAEAITIAVDRAHPRLALVRLSQLPTPFLRHGKLRIRLDLYAEDAGGVFREFLGLVASELAAAAAKDAARRDADDPAGGGGGGGGAVSAAAAVQAAAKGTVLPMLRQVADGGLLPAAGQARAARAPRHDVEVELPLLLAGTPCRASDGHIDGVAAVGAWWVAQDVSTGLKQCGVTLAADPGAALVVRVPPHLQHALWPGDLVVAAGAGGAGALAKLPARSDASLFTLPWDEAAPLRLKVKRGAAHSPLWRHEARGLGRLLGLAVLRGSPLDLPLSRCAYKGLMGEALTRRSRPTTCAASTRRSRGTTSRRSSRRAASRPSRRR